MPQPERPRRTILILASLLVLWPLLAIGAVRHDAVPAALLLLIAAILIGRLSRFITPVVGSIAGVYATICIGLAYYRFMLGDWLDLGLTLAMPDDTYHAVLLWLGAPLFTAAIAAMAAHSILYALAFTKVARAIDVPKWLAVLTIGFFFLTPPHRKLVLDTGTSDVTARIKPLMTKEKYFVQPGESIFIVQLESLNGIAANGEYDKGDPHHRGSNDVMKRLARNGIYLPHTWAHDIQTHRASEAFMCGAVRNLGPKNAIDQIDADCIPDIFREAGYRTVFLSSWFDEEFANKGDLMEDMGYDDVRFADSLMKRGDQQALWGYDEVAFFRRAFEYLGRKYRADQPLLVHLAVCAHHAGFSRNREDDREWFAVDREKQIEIYLRSARKQDASLQAFWDLYRKYTGENAHVFIFGDHSFPLGLYSAMLPHLGTTIDNFVTPMVYIPPKSRAAEFALGRTIDTLHAHSDLPPTFVELVTRKPQANSLVPFFRKTPPAQYEYEQCHVMAQPFGLPGLLIAHGTTTYRYQFMSECVDRFNITYNPLRQHHAGRKCGVPFETYERQYTCARYR
jgi:phosphoglycerol transferase MdoB-like AlkP superfamily enzyme